MGYYEKKCIFAPPKGASLYIRYILKRCMGRNVNYVIIKNELNLMEQLGIGLQLMIVGMLTVFAILLIVIYGGKLLIKFVNFVAPEEVVSAKKALSSPNSGGIDAPTMAILQEVVKQLTGGKGRVESAKKTER